MGATMSSSQTTELREKLDKLGIEHLDSDLPNNKQTRWNKGAGGWGACYVEITNGSILPVDDSIIGTRTLRIYDCTPEQAIAATLGSDQELINLAYNAWSMAICAMQGMPIPAEWGNAVEHGLRKYGINVNE